MYYSVFRSDTQRQLKKIENADLVIGMTSYKNAQVAATVANTVLKGVRKYFPHLRTVLINADAGKNAETRQAILAQAFDNRHNSLVVSGRYDGVLGQGNAIAALFDAALALNARAIIILDSQSDTITPNWVAGLAHLILEDKADLVLPRYRQWHFPEGMLSDLLVYPLFRALWGQSIRHPAAPDFALSPALAAALLDEDVWGTAVAASGLMPWLTTFATLLGWRVAQTALGGKYLPKRFLASDPAEADCPAKFHDVLSVMFGLMYRYQDLWKAVSRFQSAPTLTRFSSQSDQIADPEIDVPQLLDNLAVGWMEHRLLWQQILTPANLNQIEALAALPPDQFYFPSDLWARVMYDFAVMFNFGEADPAQIVASLFPLYQGRLAAFWFEIAGLASVGREGTVAAQAVEFEETRSYLKMRWQTHQPRPYQSNSDDRPLWYK